MQLNELDNYDESSKEKENKEEKSETNFKKNDSNIVKNINVKNDDDNTSLPSNTVGKKIMKVILQNLNSYWIELIASINLIITILIYEVIVIILMNAIKDLIENKSIDGITKFIDVIINKLGVKWATMIDVADHLSVGFFCLTTFSGIFQETLNVKKFYIMSFIKVALYYCLSIFILGAFLNYSLKNHIYDTIENSGFTFVEDNKDKVINLFNELIDYLVIIVADFLSSYNIFLDKLVLGTLYIFLFVKPKKCANNAKYLLIFRILSFIPISFIIVSLVLRALQEFNILELNEYILAFLLGPKVTIYGFFIVTLFVIKYNANKYDNIFDEDNMIDTKIFNKIGSIIFAIFGGIELIVGLFFPDLTSIGIGSRYLIILCAPIFTLYDYKKIHKVTFPCCNKGDMSKCFKIIIYIVGYSLVVVLGIIIIVITFNFIKDYIKPLLTFLVEGLETISNILNFLKSKTK